MTTKEILHKYIFIIERVKKGDYPNLETIKNYVNSRFEEIDTTVGFSERTFLRDKKDIADLYNIDITYDRANNGYYIVYLNESDDNSRTLEALNIFLTLSEANRNNLSNIIIPDNKCSLGTENLNSLLHAVRNQQYVQFAYSKYYNDSTTIRNIAPYSIKESQGRWYLIGKDQDDSKIKVFGIDRISSPVLSQMTFKIDPTFNAANFFKYRFGVNASCEYGEVENVSFKITNIEAKYLLTKPLHPSQIIVDKTDTHMTFSVEVYPSIDFIMELLSYGEKIKVLSPQWLVEHIKTQITNALQQY